jgi:hypothetical protein
MHLEPKAVAAAIGDVLKLGAIMVAGIAAGLLPALRTYGLSLAAGMTARV